MDSHRKNIASIMITCKYSRQVGRQNEKHSVPYLPDRHDCLYQGKHREYCPGCSCSDQSLQDWQS